MRLNEKVVPDPHNPFQTIDVLRVITEQQSLVLQETNEGVSERRLERLVQVVLLLKPCKFHYQVKGIVLVRIVYKVLQIEQQLWRGEIVVIQVIIQPTTGGSKIRDSGRHRNTRTR